MYKTTYYAINVYSDKEEFSVERFFTSKVRALDYLRRKTNETMPSDRDRMWGCDLYCSITEYEEVEGLFLDTGSELFSYCSWESGEIQKNEGTTRLTMGF
jgi:hypothetical protein